MGKIIIVAVVKKLAVPERGLIYINKALVLLVSKILVQAITIIGRIPRRMVPPAIDRKYQQREDHSRSLGRHYSDLRWNITTSFISSLESLWPDDVADAKSCLDHSIGCDLLRVSTEIGTAPTVDDCYWCHGLCDKISNSIIGHVAWGSAHEIDEVNAGHKATAAFGRQEPDESSTNYSRDQESQYRSPSRHTASHNVC